MNEDRIERLEKQVDVQDKLFRGDLDANPIKPGLQQVLQQIFDVLNDPKKGNTKLDERTTAIEKKDEARVNWISGARWILHIIIAAAGFVLGIIYAKH